MKKLTLSLLIGLVALFVTSCETDEINQSSNETEASVVNQAVPIQLKGEYTLHTGAPTTGKEPVVITISDNKVWIKDMYNLDLIDYRVFVNGDCWMIIYLSDTTELRFSDYMKEQNLIHLTLWENGIMTQELGVYDKTLPLQQ
ncbi:hypothetical protein FUA48_00855 [Flavobacterium alkalisoli]|uniref:Lipoprotein n=1 Tax=Flavobacterium alkalisoli TaxID=2602769 RepID=A0A5B9FTT5_9FLAO|nr:hypothetical protein [Flavobacterium alkalisoli]QEE48177.1 hypothetical protein FUA48_00855 [Flavobacterium alkalisoli]